jgi:hypothetical protein
MTPAEHDKRQAESDAAMEQWDAARPERLRKFAHELRTGFVRHTLGSDDITAMLAEVERLRGEVETSRKVIHDQADEIQNLRSVHREIRRKAEAFDVIVAAENKVGTGSPGVSRYKRDDEIVGSGDYHIERMDNGLFWARFGDRVFYFSTKRNATIRLHEECDGEDRRGEKEETP